MLLSLFFFFFHSLLCFSLSHPLDANARLGKYSQLQLTSGVGPESLSFDCKGEGPYIGISDGRILKWNGDTHGWIEFAITSPERERNVCDGISDPKLENSCGRPLGLQFHNVTCDLYVADAYFGLVVVGSNGGVGRQLANNAEGVPFRFTNGLDIDWDTGVVYFTDSSTQFQRRFFRPKTRAIGRWRGRGYYDQLINRRAYLLCIFSGDHTGRLMKYDPRSKEVTVLLRTLAFANGVALSKDKSFLLIAETATKRILRFWLQGSKAQTSEVFLQQLPSYPDNIKRNARGEFWVAMTSNMGRLRRSIQAVETTSDVVALKLDEEGRVLEKLYDDGKGNLDSISEAYEYDEKLWFGSVSLPYVTVYNYKV